MDKDLKESTTKENMIIFLQDKVVELETQDEKDSYLYKLYKDRLDTLLSSEGDK